MVTVQSVTFNGTPYQFYGFVKGLFVELYIGLDNEPAEYSCFTYASKDEEEQPPDYISGNPFLEKSFPKIIKRVVSRQIEVIPNENSSIVYLRFWGKNEPVLGRSYGWINAQSIPDKKSKLIPNFDYSRPLFKVVWDSIYKKLISEGWIIDQESIISASPKLPKREKGSPISKTAGKLEKLRQIRDEALSNNREIPKQIAACNLALISPSVARKHAPLLWKNWYNYDYRPPEIE